MPMVFKYGVMTKLLEGYNDLNGKNDNKLTLFLNFDAPGEEWGINANNVIRQYWQLINFIDSSSNLFEMDLETNKQKQIKDNFFVFDWLGELKTQNTLCVEKDVFLELINLLLDENPNSPIFNIQKIKNTRIINQFF